MNEECATREVVVINIKGLHARPAPQIAKTAAHYESVIQVIKDGEEADAKSVLSLLILAASKGTCLKLSARGGDRVEALDALEELFLNRFGED